MSDFLNTIRGVVLFDDAVYASLRERTNSLQTVLLLFLLAGLTMGVSSCWAAVQAPPDAVDLRAQLNESIGANLNQIPGPERRIIEENIRAGIDIAVGISQLRPPMGFWPSRIIGGIGAWLAQPFVLLAGWIFYALFVWVIARMFLKGTGDIRQHLTLTGVYVTPYIGLGLLIGIPFIGGLFGFALWLWGTAIYIKGISAANELDTGTSIVAWILPAVILAVLVFCGVLVGLLPLFALIGSAGG